MQPMSGQLHALTWACDRATGIPCWHGAASLLHILYTWADESVQLMSILFTESSPVGIVMPALCIPCTHRRRTVCAACRPSGRASFCPATPSQGPGSRQCLPPLCALCCCRARPAAQQSPSASSPLGSPCLLWCLQGTTLVTELAQLQREFLRNSSCFESKHAAGCSKRGQVRLTTAQRMSVVPVQRHAVSKGWVLDEEYSVSCLP